MTHGTTVDGTIHGTTAAGMIHGTAHTTDGAATMAGDALIIMADGTATQWHGVTMVQVGDITTATASTESLEACVAAETQAVRSQGRTEWEPAVQASEGTQVQCHATLLPPSQAAQAP